LAQREPSPTMSGMNADFRAPGGLMNTLRGGVFSRASKQAALNNGIVVSDLNDQAVFRDPNLEKLDSYFENRQYAKLLPFEQDKDAAGASIPLRARQPRFKVPFARSLSSIVASKLLGPTVFPSFKVPDSPDDQAYWKAILDASELQMFLLEPIRRMINTGEIFVRFYLSGGAFVKSFYDTKYCYPQFDDAGELEMVTIKYVYADADDKDSNGSPKKKWYRLDLGQEAEVLYDNPPYIPAEQEPQFNPVMTVEHGFGFVQGEWMTTTGVAKGYGLIADITDFIDELAYSLSQSSKALSYNQDPQTILKGMSSEEIDELVRSSTKAWNLGRTGEAEFLESDLNGVSVGMELRDKVRQNISDFTRIVLLDPEKIVGNAQSAKAMEVLHGPLKDLVDELRLPVGSALKRLVMKMGAANILGQHDGMEVPLPLPDGFQLTTLALELKWPAIFQQTLEDLKNKVGIASQAQGAGLIGPITAIRYIAEDFGIEDIEAELQAIIAHQQMMAALNPFNSGGF
jgi:hypothetical protein